MNLKSNKAVYLYGALLSLTHWVTLYHWRVQDFEFGLFHTLSQVSENPWPFVAPWFMEAIATSSKFVIMAYVITSLIAPVLFLLQKKLAWVFFALALALKISIYLTTYDYMGNYHYMNHILLVLFLVPGHRILRSQIILALFYFGAGLLKLNWEWISGSALLVPTFISGIWLQLACLYVIVLELLLIWGAFSQRKWIRYSTLAQLIFFHIFSWHIVGYYYPMIMMLMLPAFIFRPEINLVPFDLKTKPWFVTACILVFMLAQAYPKMLNSDSALTSEGRMLSLNMLDAKLFCHSSFSYELNSKMVYEDDAVIAAVRTRCDPLLYFNRGKQICKQLRSSGEQDPKVFASLIVRKLSDEKWTQLFSQVEMCDETLTYSVLGNDWVVPALSEAILPGVSTEASSKEVREQVWRGNNERTGESTFPAPSVLNMSLEIPIDPQCGIHSAAKSSPLLLSGGIVRATDCGEISLYKADGKAWSANFRIPSRGFHASPAVTSDSMILIGDYQGYLHALNSENGKRIWAVPLKDRASEIDFAGAAIGSSVGLHEGRLFVAAESLPDHSIVYSLEAKTGKRIWSSESLPGLAHASVSLDAMDPTVVVVATNTGTVAALDFETGKVVWKLNFPNTNFVATPVVHQGRVFLLGQEGFLVQLELKDGKELWSTKERVGTRSSPSLDRTSGILISATSEGAIQGRDWATGKLLWTYDKVPHKHLSSGFIAIKPRTVYIDQCGPKKLCQLDLKTGQLLTSVQIPEDLSASPILTEKSEVVILLSDRILGFGNKSIK